MKTIIGVLSVMVCLASCQIDKKSDSQTTSVNGIEINLECKNVEKNDLQWQITMLSEDLYIKSGAGKPQKYLQLNKQEMKELEALLRDCKANKIKAKKVSNNDKKEWYSARISTYEFTLDIAETENTRLTKKSRRKIKILYAYLNCLITSEQQNEPLHAEVRE